MTSEFLKTLFDSYKEIGLKNRYIHNDHIQPLLSHLKKYFIVEQIGKSVLGQPIHSIKIGAGSKKILMWSQMHGNESTTTKAIFDICNVIIKDNSDSIKQILANCTIVMVPILNPDGAKLYTRHNANDIDLNRDAKDLTQPESVVLRNLFNRFKPDFCFNLHGQRTIFGIESSKMPATLSFLAPAQDKECSVTDTRKKAMEVISEMNAFLQLEIPNQIGIYDDSYNENCVGDTFQALNCPTILFEAGHFMDDYNREITRLYMFKAMLLSIGYISNNEVLGNKYVPYLDIPENRKNFLDVIIRNVKIKLNNESLIADVGVQYAETLIDDSIQFIPKIEKIGDLGHLFAHKNILGQAKKLSLESKEELSEGLVVEAVFLGQERCSLKLT